jgi:hypothetical protein
MRNLKLFTYTAPILLILYSYFPLTQAKWAVIDDHEIVNFIGNQTSLPIADIPKVLNTTEIGVNQTIPRFRPTYFTLRVAFSSFIGHHPGVWHALQILILISFTVALTKICLFLAGPLLSLGFVFFAISQPYISDSISRLGPGENYAIWGVSLLMFGGLRFYQQSKWDISASLLMFFGVIFAAGSKENFLILVILPLWILFLPKIKAPLFSKVTALLSLTFTAWIALSIISRLSSSESDVYGNSTSVESRVNLIFSLLQRSDFLIWLFGVFIIYQLTAYLRRHHQLRKEDGITLNKYCWISLLLLGIYSFQYFFYAGKWPDAWGGTYYSFPGTLAKEFAILLMLLAALKISSIRFSLEQKTIQSAYYVIAISYLIISLFTINYAHQVSVRLTNGTQQFDHKLQELFTFLRLNPSAAIYLNYPTEIDFEPNVSMERFIRAAGFKNRIFVTTKGELQANSIYNDTNHQSDKCFAVGMNGPASSNCKYRNYVSYFWGPPSYNE